MSAPKNCQDGRCGGCPSCLAAQGIFDGELPCSSCDKLHDPDDLNAEGECLRCETERRITEQAAKEAKET